MFTAGTGTIDIGGAGNTANFYVGQNPSPGGTASGTVDFSSLSSLNANLNNLYIGVSSGGSAAGSVKLASTNMINALNIVVGSSGGGGDSLTLGHSNTILANTFTIAQDFSSATVTLPTGGSLNLGSSSARTLLQIGNNSGGTNNIYTGTLNLANGSLNAYLSSLIVGKDTGGTAGVGGVSGTLTAGTGTINVGAAGNTASIYIGQNTTSGGTASGSVDFSSLTSLSTNLNTLSIGTSVGGSSVGSLKLASTNTINALGLIVGYSGDGNDSLVLGQSNTILANQFTIGEDFSSGTVSIPDGGSLTLGSTSAPLNLSIAVGITNTNNTYGGSLNLTNATLRAYLGNVIIGTKDTQPGNEVGTFTISNNPANYISAASVALGGNQSTGTLNYGGGVFYAGSITKGVGTANFNWTGGTLSVGTFGSPAIPFALNNTGTGTLAPGTAAGAIGTTTIYGSYTQGAAAATNIRIASNSPGTGNDQVNISQAAALAGTLSLSVTNNFVPAVGESFLIETYASHTGTYGFVVPPSLPPTVAFQLDYTTSPTQLMVEMVNPITQNYISTASSGFFGTASNWNTSTTPGTASRVIINNSGTAAQTVTVGASTTVQSVMLSGTTSPLNFEIPQGIQLGVANQVLVGNNATLSGGGQVDGSVTVSGGTVIAAAASTFTITGGVGNLIGSTLTGGTWIVDAGATLNFPAGDVITTNQANVTLGGANASFPAFTGFTTNGAQGSFTVTGGATFATAGVLANNGNVTVGANSSLSGSMSGTGTAVVAAGGILTASAFTQNTLANNGSFSISGNGTITSVNGAGNTTIGNGSTGAVLGVGSLAQNGVAINTGSLLTLIQNPARCLLC